MSVRGTIASAISRSSDPTICEVCQQPIDDDRVELPSGEPAHRVCVRKLQAIGRATQERRDRT